MKLKDIRSPAAKQIWEEQRGDNKVIIDKVDKTHVYFTILDKRGDRMRDNGLLSVANFTKTYKKTRLN